MVRVAAILAGLLALTALAYAPVLSAPFAYEDRSWVFSAPATWQKPAGRAEWIPGRALTTWTIGATAQAVGYDARVFHAQNLAIHLANGVLVYGMASAIVSPPAGIVAAAVFLWLPLNSQAVSYVSARADLLVTFFTLAAIWLAMGSAWWRWPLVVVALLGAALSKEIGLIAVPIVIWTVVCLRPSWRDGAALGCLVGVASLLMWQSRAVMELWRQAPDVGWSAFLSHELVAVWYLLSLTVRPDLLSIDHDYLALGPVWRVSSIVLTWWAVIVACAAWPVWPRVTWTIGVVALSVGPRFLFPNSEYIHERHLYLGTAAISLCVGWLGVAAWQRWCSPSAPALTRGAFV